MSVEVTPLELYVFLTLTLSVPALMSWFAVESGKLGRIRARHVVILWLFWPVTLAMGALIGIINLHKGILFAWGILTKDAPDAFRRLMELR